ncbi:MAG: bifunctional DNA primase/polymerase [Phycisphaerales bacterium]|nr:bifunctional DNA primase/polymerase [Phycisphaerales bacterium]
MKTTETTVEVIYDRSQSVIRCEDMEGLKARYGDFFFVELEKITGSSISSEEKDRQIRLLLTLCEDNRDQAIGDLADSFSEYVSAGLSAMPAIRSQKRPIGSWKQFQTRLPTQGEVKAWSVPEQYDAVCIITGSVSGNAEMIDFDGGGELFEGWKALIPAELFTRLVVERTPRGGYHVFYRCETAVEGNRKLVMRERADGKPVTLIETRGEGGLFLCAPTAGYEVIQGDIAHPPVLCKRERDFLFCVANDLRKPGMKTPPRGAVMSQRRQSYPPQPISVDATGSLSGALNLLVSLPLSKEEKAEIVRFLMAEKARCN